MSVVLKSLILAFTCPPRPRCDICHKQRLCKISYSEQVQRNLCFFWESWYCKKGKCSFKENSGV